MSGYRGLTILSNYAVTTSYRQKYLSLYRVLYRQLHKLHQATRLMKHRSCSPASMLALPLRIEGRMLLLV